jgi:hypothetical protein
MQLNYLHRLIGNIKYILVEKLIYIKELYIQFSKVALSLFFGDMVPTNCNNNFCKNSICVSLFLFDFENKNYN